jgi:hypothetical protein
MPLNSQVRRQAHRLTGESSVRPLGSESNILPIIRLHHEHFDRQSDPELVDLFVPEMPMIRQLGAA